MIRTEKPGSAYIRKDAVSGTRFVTSVLALIAVSCPSGGVHAGDLVPPPGAEGYFADPENSADFAQLTLHFLNELSARRRLTTVFPNEQSPFYGVQLNYVNVREGNLTFLMRDMVRGAAVPIVFGRIHDSRKQDEADFGPGWKLSIAESLERTDDGLLYTDASNSMYVLNVDGSRIWSDHPHLTGIHEGSLHVDSAVLRTGNLTKTFRRRGNSLVLAEVQDQVGNWLRFTYAQGVMNRVFSSTGRYVDIVRDRSMKIVGARDDTGRTTRYVYDGVGRLTESHGVDGEVTRYRYDREGFLAEVVDSRGVQSIVARFHEDGRAATVRSQHDRMSYEFGANSTTVRNANQQASVLAYHGSGLIESVTDFGGGVTVMELDQALRVQRLSFNGTTIASAEYEEGRLAVLNRFDSYYPTKQLFSYDARGRLTQVERDGEIVARYAYDALDRPIYAEDSSLSYNATHGSHGYSASGPDSAQAEGAVRRYRFDARGSLNEVSIGGTTFGVVTNRLGMIERMTWGEGDFVAVTYGDTDRVAALRFRTDGADLRSEYAYNGGGFRVSGRYDALEPLGDNEIELDYDSAGNLIRMKMPGPEDTERVVQHTIGPQNQLLLLTPLGEEALAQAIEYDQGGRPIRAVVGSGQREATFHYDELGRLTDVYLDREHVLTSNHGPMDLDPVHASDYYSAFTAVSDPVASGVFGSLDEIVYTRLFGTPYGIARFIPEMARFVISHHAVAPPDSVLLASLRRRNLASENTLDPSPLFGFDKPSSSLFVPPEYFTSNCATCVGVAVGFRINRLGASGSTAITGETLTFRATADGWYCYYYTYETGTIFLPFGHEVQFLGGGGTGSGAYQTGLPTLQFSGSYSTPGEKTVRDTLRCSCGGIFLAQAEQSVQVQTLPCTQEAYAYHQSNPYIGGLFQSIQRSGSLLNGQITINVRVQATPTVFNDFKNWIEAAWNKTFVSAGVNMKVNVQLVHNDIFADVKVLMPLEMPIGGPSPQPPPPNCGTFSRTTSSSTPSTILVRINGYCNASATAAHEFGHYMKFADAYVTQSNLCAGSVHCDATDVMACGSQVHPYHARLLWERL